MRNIMENQGKQKRIVLVTTFLRKGDKISEILWRIRVNMNACVYACACMCKFKLVHTNLPSVRLLNTTVVCLGYTQSSLLFSV